jgi:hypothetical protein
MGFFQDLQAFRAFSNLSVPNRQIVFYSEGPPYWAHLRPIIRCLTEEDNRPVTYVTSDPNDPGFAQPYPNLTALCIGTGLIRSMWFRLLEAEMLVLTLPDLENSIIKRSKYPVHYTYVFHSIVSTHMIYQTGAFDHYDSILCVGPHHEREIRETERHHNLPAKELVQHGYGRLDEIIAEQAAAPRHHKKPNDDNLILIAPSWGPNGLIESGRATELVETLLCAGFRVILRPHPESIKRAHEEFSAVVRTYEQHPKFQHEIDVDSKHSLMKSDLMISDWSGVALEYAFGLKKPVLFIDVPRKLNNPEIDRYVNRPLEETVREQIGAVLTLDNISQAGIIANELIASQGVEPESICSLRNAYVFNNGKSGRVAADWISQRLELP